MAKQIHKNGGLSSNWRKMLPGYQIENKILSNLSYADDLPIMSYYRTYLQNILNVLAKDALEAENFKNEVHDNW